MAPDEHIRNIRSVQQILYSRCKESDYKEPDSIAVGNGLKMAVHVKKTRPEEWCSTSYVSLDVPSQRPARVGETKWTESDARADEKMMSRYLPLREPKNHPQPVANQSPLG